MKQNPILRIFVSIAAISLAAAHVWKPEVRIDSITLALLVICFLPWVQPLVKTIEIPGLKLELQEMKKNIAQATGAAASAIQLSTLAVSGSDASSSSLSHTRSAMVDLETVRALANEYEDIRKKQRSGDTRTSAMTDVVRRMIDVAHQMESFNASDALSDDNSGLRLFGYAYLYAQPNALLLSPLVEAVCSREDAPFSQYWGLQSIGRQISNSVSVPPETWKKLRAFKTKIPRGSDRDFELRKLLDQA